ncbi:MAG: RNA polymerase-interacting CarD/CdnL/TRCF family regulator [Lysobacterales bacterium]
MTFIVLEKELPDQVRKLMPQKQAKQILDLIRTWDGKPSSAWKVRSEAHQRAIDSGDPFECAKAFRELHEMAREDALRPQDNAHLNQINQLLSEELARSLNKADKQIRQLISEALDS